jgi:hypothetical protein
MEGNVLLDRTAVVSNIYRPLRATTGLRVTLGFSLELFRSVEITILLFYLPKHPPPSL